jgi:hypothetical protein
MKKLLTIPLLSFLCGCALLNPNATADQKAAQVKSLSYAAASIGTQVEITRNPNSIVGFGKAYDDLGVLLQSKVVTGAALRSILATLPVSKLQSPTAIIIIQDVTVLYDATVGTNIDLTKAPLALAAAQGIHDGIGAALGKPVSP